MEKIEIHGMANITSGGFYENIPRMFKDGSPALDAVITEGSWTIPPIFARIAPAITGADSSGPAAQKRGAELLKTDAVLKKQMFNTFNMGIGFVLALAPADVRQAIEHLDTMNFPAYTIGKVEKAADVNAAQGVLRFAGN
jgi:phosphoribosylformylglycinamidine cyclo-ligase